MNDLPVIQKTYQSWAAHLKHADSYHLREDIFTNLDGWLSFTQ